MDSATGIGASRIDSRTCTGPEPQSESRGSAMSEPVNSRSSWWYLAEALGLVDAEAKHRRIGHDAARARIVQRIMTHHWAEAARREGAPTNRHARRTAAARARRA